MRQPLPRLHGALCRPGGSYHHSAGSLKIGISASRFPNGSGHPTPRRSVTARSAATRHKPQLRPARDSSSHEATTKAPVTRRAIALRDHGRDSEAVTFVSRLRARCAFASGKVIGLMKVQVRERGEPLPAVLAQFLASVDWNRTIGEISQLVVLHDQLVRKIEPTPAATQPGSCSKVRGRPPARSAPRPPTAGSLAVHPRVSARWVFRHTPAQRSVRSRV